MVGIKPHNHGAEADYGIRPMSSNPDILTARLKRVIEDATAALAAVGRQDTEAFRQHSETILSLAYFIAPNAPFQNDHALALLRQVAANTDAEWGRKLARDFFGMTGEKGSG